MKYRYINLPVYHDKNNYHEAIQRMLESLSKVSSILSVFSIGGIGNPGISDIDLYVVFKDGTSFLQNPVTSLKGYDRYLFTHNLFGTSLSNATKMEQFTFFGKYNLLYGKQVNMFDFNTSETDLKPLKSQIALEYLLKAFISIASGRRNGVIKVRSLLLHAKALLLDLKLMNIQDGKLHSVISEIITIRNNWFTNKDSVSNLDACIDTYHNALKSELSGMLENHELYTGTKILTRLSGNIFLKKTNKFRIQFNGVKLPSVLTAHSNKLLKLQSKINSTYVMIPSSDSIPSPILIKRSEVLSAGIAYNQTHLPGFICTAYAMNIFKN